MTINNDEDDGARCGHSGRGGIEDGRNDTQMSGRGVLIINIINIIKLIHVLVLQLVYCVKLYNYFKPR